MSVATSKIVFLIDEQSLMTSLLSLGELKLSIMRLLIYYHFQKRHIQWGFRFFSTQTRYPSESMRRFYPLTLDSLEALEKEYTKRDKNRPKQVVLGTPIMRIKQVLKEVIGDFQWENNDLGSAPEAIQNHIFILSACPSSLIEMKQFFVSPHPDDSKPLSVASLPQYFEQTKHDLSSTLLQSYASRNIALSIIDVYRKLRIRPHDQWLERVTRQGLASCLDQFKGHYIPIDLLLRKNTCLYGRSFLSDIHSLCTNSESQSVWKGSLKTATMSLDEMNLRNSLHEHGSSHLSTHWTFVSEIRVTSVMHLSQFSPDWLFQEAPLGDFVLTQNNTSLAFRQCLSELFETKSIMIAELVPMEGFESQVEGKTVCIEAYSPEAAFVRFVTIKEMPKEPDNGLANNDHYPIGSHCLTGGSLPLDLPNEPQEVSYKIKQLPDHIRQMIVMPNPSSTRPKKQKSDSSVQKDRSPQPIEQKKKAALPTNVDMLEKCLDELYCESIYTQKYTMDHIIHTIKRWLNNLSRNHTIQDIIDILFKFAFALEDLETKYKTNIPQPTETNALEQTFQQTWWRQVKAKFKSDSRSEKLIGLAAKTREAQVQVILYCFICRLMLKLPTSTVKRDPISSAEDFFQKVVVTLSMHDLGKFLGELDSEEGPQAIKRRDPCDLSDHAFMTVLEKRFQQLPELLQKFKELSGTDEMTSSESSDLEEDVNNLDVIHFEPLGPMKPSSSPKSKTYRQQKRPMPDVLPVASSSTKKMHASTLLPSSSRSFAPVKIKKTNSNTLDMFLKRTVDVKSSVPAHTEALRGEAAQAAIAKVNRSTVNGRPTMKRSGSFTSSAQATKKQKKKKTEPSMLSSQQETTGTVILRRSNNIPNTEETTPRTSMNRYLGTNLFADFSETCLSPSNRTDRTQESIPIPKTPESTPLRYRKIMMDRTPHRREPSETNSVDNWHASPEDALSKPPYTPRTAARRERDRMDRSQSTATNIGLNLTMRLQSLYEQERAKEDEFSLKSSRQSSGIFFEDALNEVNSPVSSQHDTNPFLTASSQASTATVSPNRPSIKRGATIDDLFDENDDMLMGEEDQGVGLLPFNFAQPYMIGEEDESDSDEEHHVPLI